MSPCQERMISSPQVGGGWTRWLLVVSSSSVILILSIMGSPRPLCPVVGPPEELVGHCVRQEAELDGSLV